MNQKDRDYLKTIRDIAVKQEVESDGPNKSWYILEYFELATERLVAPLAVALPFIVYLGYKNPDKIIPCIEGILFLVAMFTAFILAALVVVWATVTVSAIIIVVLKLLVGLLVGLVTLPLRLFRSN